MKKVPLTLLSYPALLGSAISFAPAIAPVQAAEIAGSAPPGEVLCVQSSYGQQRSVCTRFAVDCPGKPRLNPVQNQPGDPSRLEFTDEESDTSIALFGCDCPTCLNALRQIRSQSAAAN